MSGLPDYTWSSENSHYGDEQTAVTGFSSDGYSGGLPRRLRSIVEREGDVGSRPLSVAGSKLDEKFVSGTGHACTWRRAVEIWKDWVRGYEDTCMLVEDESGDRVEVSLDVRFSPERARRDYARLQNLHEGLVSEWGDGLYCAFLTFTASSRNVRGGWRCPVDHLNDINEGLNASLQSLRRSLDGREWCYAHVLEGQKSGYLHRHLAVFVKGPVSEGDFRSCIDTHVNTCPSAGREAHRYEDCIRVERVGGREGEVRNIAYYLSEYVADSFRYEDPTEAPDHVLRANAVLTASNSRRIGFSENAHDFIEVGYEVFTGNSFDGGDGGVFSLVGLSFDGGESFVEVDVEGEDGGRMVESRVVMPDKLDPEKCLD